MAVEPVQIFSGKYWQCGTKRTGGCKIHDSKNDKSCTVARLGDREKQARSNNKNRQKLLFVMSCTLHVLATHTMVAYLTFQMADILTLSF